MRLLTLEEILELHRLVVRQSGGSPGLRDPGGLEAAVAQPQMTFGGTDLYPTLQEKAAVLGYSLVRNHPFIDGNKRIGHAAMEVFLVLNGLEIQAPVEVQEQTIFRLAAGEMDRDAFFEWVREHTAPRT